MSDATFLSTSLVKCRAPQIAVPLSVSISLLYNANDSSDDSLDFDYHPPARISQFIPAFGHESGGGLVTVLGSGFLKSRDTFVCKFGTVRAQLVQMLSSTRILVLSPQHPPANVTLAVSNNGQDFVFPNSDFQFTPSFSIESVFPSSGPLEGGQRVTLRGMGFSQGLACIFNGLKIAVELLSSTSIVCASPARGAGFSSVALLGAGADLDEVVLKRYVPSISGDMSLIDGVTPAVSVKVSMPGLKATAPECLYRGQRLAASMVTSSILKCGAAALTAGSSISLSVSGDGVSFTKEFFVFHHVPGVSVLQIAPSIGEMGASNEIKVVGVGFTGKNWHFRFGSASFPVVLETSSTLQVHVQPIATGKVSIVVSHDELHATGSSFSYMVHNPIQLKAVEPSHGHDIGNTVVQVRGSNFMRSSSLKCQFASAAVDAIWLSPNSIECITPPGKPGNTSLRVSNNGLQFSASFLTYEFQERAVVRSAEPCQGPVKGSSVITLSGVGFAREAGSACVFGQAVTRATVLTSSRTICESPPARAGPVPLSIRPLTPSTWQVPPYPLSSWKCRRSLPWRRVWGPPWEAQSQLPASTLARAGSTAALVRYQAQWQQWRCRAPS